MLSAQYIDKKTLNSLSKTSDKGLWFLLCDWAVIFSAILLCEYFFNPIAYLLCVLVIGGRMMGFWSLLHDGHHRLIVKNKTVNDGLTHLLIAWPLFRSVQKYGMQHAAHHKHLRTEKDPNMTLLHFKEFQFPMKSKKLALIFIRDLLGINFLYYFPKKLISGIRNFFLTKNKSSYLSSLFGDVSFSRLTYYLLIGFLLIYFNLFLEFTLYWLIPFITWYQFAIRVTLIADHCFPHNDKMYLTRTVKQNFLEKIFMVPHFLNYHTEHHLYGHIPCYNLKKLHHLLMQSEEYRKNTCVTKGYFEVMQQVTV
ncbi:MAG: hypothetical protein COA57_08200 [Flavobacteriales bacterium]|nr:MAG: hypothetical protein COA57_08200 [Flavobacteriales bacterium]